MRRSSARAADTARIGGQTIKVELVMITDAERSSVDRPADRARAKGPMKPFGPGTRRLRPAPKSNVRLSSC
jgi:hypothetical protein